MRILEKFKKMDSYRRRGIIYISISLCGILYELLFVSPIRQKVVLLWLGVILIGVVVMLTLKDSEQ